MVASNRVLTLVSIVSLSFNIAALGAIAVGLRAETAEPARERDPDRPRQELQLTPAQEQTFETLRSVFQEERERQEAAMVTLREALVGELISERPDPTRLDFLLSQIAESQGRLQRSLVQRILQEAASLRSDQRAVFTRLLERRLSRVGDRSGPRTESK